MLKHMLLSILLCLPVAAAPVTVFQAGDDGYHTYRIPAIIQSPSGDLLAFCEGRKGGTGDSGDIDLVMKRSSDGGATWGPVQLVADLGPDTIGNPAPVVVRESGRILLPLTSNLGSISEQQILVGKAPPRRVHLTYSNDDGKTWSPLRDITDQASRPEWRWYATGPGNSIQLKDGTIVVPCNHSLGPSPDTWNSHVILSKDAGETWEIGGLHGGRVNESAVVELGDGRLYHNMRNYQKTARRALSYSSDGGRTWGPDGDDPALIEPICQASAIGIADAAAAGGVAILFSNPAHEKKRENMTVRISRDMGETWRTVAELHAGPAAYSSLVDLSAGEAGCLYEAGDEHPYETIRFARFKAVD